TAQASAQVAQARERQHQRQGCANAFLDLPRLREHCQLAKADESWLEKIAIEQALDKLKEKERRVMTLRYFHGKTQAETASEIGISQAQVSRLEKMALLHMKDEI
ncbi:MAG: sigma-70 family RNA polymerase sigma factor, partial [Clostridiales bacterium]